MRIGMDLDGVYFNFDHAFVHGWLVPEKGFAVPVIDRSNWSLAPQLGITEDEFDALAAEAVDAGHLFRHGEPYEGAVQATRALVELGHKIHFVTSRNFGKMSAHNTMDWLHEHDIPYHGIHLAHDKTVMNVDVLVDDYERNWRECTAAGMRVLVMDRPWNQHLVDAERVTWPTMVDTIEAIAIEGWAHGAVA